MNKEQQIPEDIKTKIISSAQNRYGDQTIASHMRQSCYLAGGNYGYSLAQSELAEKQKEISEKDLSYKALTDQFQLLADKLIKKDKELAELKAWKESAMSVMPPMQEIGKALGVRLGESIHDKILPGIERLKGYMNAYETELQRIFERYGYSETAEVLKKFKNTTL